MSLRSIADRLFPLDVRKDPHVESLRGVAILLLVAYHAADTFDQGIDQGINLDRGSWIHYASFIFVNIRMPLFTVISGYLYAQRPVAQGQVKPFLQGKARRLLLPYFSLMTAALLLVWIDPAADQVASASDVPLRYLESILHFWFLLALALVFIVVVGLELIGGLATPARVIGLILVSFAVEPFVREIDLLQLSGAAYLFPYFLVGLGVHRFGDLLGPRSVTAFTVVFLVAFGLQNAQWFELVDFNTGRYSFVGSVIGVSSGVTLLSLSWSSPLLARIGGQAFPIYLFHGFALAAASRVLPVDLGDGQSVASRFVAAVVLSLLATTVVKRFGLLSTVLMGQRGGRVAGPSSG